VAVNIQTSQMTRGHKSATRLLSATSTIAIYNYCSEQKLKKKVDTRVSILTRLIRLRLYVH